jgi:hypothetical protein
MTTIRCGNETNTFVHTHASVIEVKACAAEGFAREAGEPTEFDRFMGADLARWEDMRFEEPFGGW